MRERAKNIPRMDDKQCAGTPAHRTYHQKAVNPNTRFVGLMHEACLAIRESATASHIEQAPKDLFDATPPITVHRFDWNKEIKQNKNFGAAMHYAKMMLQEAPAEDQIIEPKKEFPAHLKAGVENISLMDITDRFQDTYPQLSEQFKHRLETQQNNVEKGNFEFMLSRQALFQRNKQGPTRDYTASRTYHHGLNTAPR